jgi:hypothetical protein
LQELTAPYLINLEPGGGDGYAMQLLPALAGAGQLRTLDLSAATAAPRERRGPVAAAPEPPPLDSLGLSGLTELVFRGCPVGGAALGGILQGLTSLRRLDVSGTLAPPRLGVASGGGGFDDAALRALGSCRLPHLEELDARYNPGLEGRFGGGGGGGGGGDEDGGGAAGGGGAVGAAAAAEEVWRGLAGLRDLRLHDTGVTGRAAVAGLAAALGGSLRRLDIDSMCPASLAALCQHAPGLRSLQVTWGGLTVADLERLLPRLGRLERLELRSQNPLVIDAERLKPLARRLRGGRVVVDGIDVTALVRAEAASGRDQGGQQQPSPQQGRRPSGGGREGLASFDQRLRYARADLKGLQSSPVVAAAAGRVREALLTAGAEEGVGLGILRPDW